jgi:hypothetical protein
MTGYTRKQGRLLQGNEWWLVPKWMTNEDWFVWSEWIAEFWCCVSMAPLLVVGLWWLTTHPLGALLAVGASLASALYHAHPSRRLLRLDQLFALGLLVWMATFFRLSLWLEYAVPLALLLTDTIARFRGRPIPHIHPFWHLSGPVAMHLILSSTL